MLRTADKHRRDRVLELDCRGWAFFRCKAKILGTAFLFPSHLQGFGFLCWLA